MRNTSTYDKPLEGNFRKEVVDWLIVENPLGMNGG
jgi:hypothetical protein